MRAVSRMGGRETGRRSATHRRGRTGLVPGRKAGDAALRRASAGRRFVYGPMPLRRTDRIAGQAGHHARAGFDAFDPAERLADAVTPDASFFKAVPVSDRSRLTAALMLRNLLGDADTPYGGYESTVTRAPASGPGDRHPLHAPRHALHLCVAPFVLSYNLLPILSGSQKRPVFFDFTMKFVFCKGERTLKLPKP